MQAAAKAPRIKSARPGAAISDAYAPAFHTPFMILFLDFETHSTVNIRRGTDAYMGGARPLLGQWAIDDGPVQIHDFTVEPHSWGITDALMEADKIVAHYSFFEQMVTRRLLGIRTNIENWHCTQAQALAHSLPGGLDALCTVLGVPADLAKIADGKRLIRKFCGPKPFEKKPEDAADWELFKQYAINDITAMRECYRRMPNWNYKDEEHRVWQVDQIINHRGFAIDLQFANEAVKALDSDKARLDAETSEATNGAVTAATQRDKMLLYLCEKQGCILRDLTASTIADALLDESLDESTRTLLKLRQDSTKASTSKFKRLQESVGSDGRLRGTLQYSGAARTARWSGRIFQPQNLPRPTMTYSPEPGKTEVDTVAIRACIELMKQGRADVITPLFAESIGKAASNALRGLIVSQTGKLLISDWSAIEGRINAWIAGEDWKTKAFRDGLDLYCLIYERAFNLPPGAVKKGDARRQIGKVMELALGYGGGVGAFLNMAAAYDLDLEELGRMVQPVEKARENWERALKSGETYGLTPEIYMACDTLKIGYRKGNPEITQSWYAYENAMRQVIEQRDPTNKVQVGMLLFDADRDGNWCRIKLPSGRYLCYALPRIVSLRKAKQTPDADGKFEADEGRSTITYMAWRNKKWSRTKTYGGKICENIVQAIARDLLAASLVKAEDRGFNPVLHVHDEIICESDTKTLDELIALMVEKPRWAAGLPLNAEGFSGTRYEKH